jgi:hypothetical protein
MILQKELRSNLVVIPSDLLENPYAVDPSQSHDGQKAAKPGPKSQTATQQESI